MKRLDKELEDFEADMAKRRRFWSGMEHGWHFIIGTAIALALGIWILVSLSTAVDCSKRTCPAGQRPETVRGAGSKIWYCTCVFE